MASICLFANPTIDTIIKNGSKYNKIGGPPSYSDAILKKSGLEYKIVSKVGPDFPLKEVSYRPIVAKKPSTKFILEYHTNGSRTLYNPVECEKINPEDVATKSRIAIVSGVFCEVLPETLEKIGKNSGVVVADIQGFIRKKDTKNRVFNVNLEETEYKDVIKNVDYLKVSEDEIGFIDAKKLGKFLTIIITRGENGCTLINKKAGEVKTERIKEVDPTGAGDCFLAGFAIGLARGYNSVKSCMVGNYFGGLAVKAVGVPVITENEFKNMESIL